MKVGRRLAMKVLNASKFVLGNVGADRAGRRAVTEPVDRALLGPAGRWSSTGPPRRSTPTTTRPRSRSAEKFFWEFCDDYLELVKERAYDEAGGAADRVRAGGARARPPRPAAAARAVPALRDRGGLVVVAGGLDPPRPLADRAELGDADGDPAMLDAVAAALVGIRGAKSQAKVVDARRAARPSEFSGPPAVLDAVRQAEDDLVAPAGSPPPRPHVASTTVPS